MRQYLLPKTGNFYKVNMHSHSTFSDGKTTPEEIKEAYKAAGYAAVAFTEHEGLFDFTYLNDESFVAITAYEYDFNTCENSPSSYYEQDAPINFSYKECLHLNLYAKDPHNVKCVCHNPKFVHCGNAKNYREQFQFVGEDNYHHSFTVECFNDVIRTAKENGFFVVYNHPNWSMNTYELYSKLEGLDGLEIINGGSHLSSDMDYVPHVYDQMARLGKRMICVGGDDNHRPEAFFTAWTMIKADALSHEALMKGLEQGNCYASGGPEIYDLYVEDGKVHIRCSAARGIYYSTAGRRKEARLAPEDGELLTEASFTVDPKDTFFRISVKDAKGEHASTRIFYLDELNEFKGE